MWAGLIMEPELNLSKTATRASNQGGGGVRPGVLGQQWVELFILREKVMQTHIRSDRLKDEGYGNTVWCKSVAFLKTEFVLIVMLYFLGIGALLGFLFIVASRAADPSGVNSKVLSAVTILASFVISGLNLVVERCRTVIEKSR